MKQFLVHDVSHDNNLAIKICLGFRTRFSIKIPHLVVHLIKRCLDANPFNRPTAKELGDILYSWYYLFDNQAKLKNKSKKRKK
jgi:hypothetical protein